MTRRLLLPLFVLAVLAALSLAARGTGRRRGGAVRPALLVALVATVAGMAYLLADSFWSLRLQLVHLDTMGSMGGLCTGTCLDKQYDATVMLQVRAVALGSLILLASNVVTVLWLLALRGGRLAVRGHGAITTAQRWAGLPRCWPPACWAPQRCTRRWSPSTWTSGRRPAGSSWC